jgi:hypothetical protein
LAISMAMTTYVWMTEKQNRSRPVRRHRPASTVDHLDSAPGSN